ncbi:TetR/AcrR family transcriptional regulator [Streptomyces sp. SID8014]|uniref:TetR/AcrR family transcriptional regulator n=1 Tax=Streptomyces sp. SID8014 TaxID=2706097 RepID=UPI0013BD830B|nr:TetR/AcrR family transcriptional regulator [Streptomyces sp. SID8014]NEC15232.1 TetR/AcrR family transcriptional regulator [Streptomyces sp. SID8014]
MSTRAPARSRTDAVRNQQLLVEAAARAFAEHGLGVPISRIVREAGLGKGTVFRCFPTKDHLVAAVVRERFGELAETAETLLAEEDAGKALRSFMASTVEVYIGDRGFFESLSLPPRSHPEVREVEKRLIDAVEGLVKRAQRQGVVRADITPVDVLLLLGGVRQAAAPLSTAVPDLWRRYLGLVFDGLAPTRDEPSLAPPAPSREQYEDSTRSPARDSPAPTERDREVHP